MSKDIVKQLLDELEIETSDHWTTKRKLGDMEFICYYYTFNDNKYCVSGDGISYVFSNVDGEILYVGYSIEKLKKTIKREKRKWEQ